jgi:hypothetical protein
MSERIEETSVVSQQCPIPERMKLPRLQKISDSIKEEKVKELHHRNNEMLQYFFQKYFAEPDPHYQKCCSSETILDQKEEEEESISYKILESELSPLNAFVSYHHPGYYSNVPLIESDNAQKT